MPWPPSLRACLTDVSSRFRRDCAPNPTKALRGDPWEPHSAPAGRAHCARPAVFLSPRLGALGLLRTLGDLVGNNEDAFRVLSR